MRLLVVFCITSMVLMANALFLDPQPDNYFNEIGDPGEALYLTKYIKSGDIETVRHLTLILMINLLY